MEFRPNFGLRSVFPAFGCMDTSSFSGVSGPYSNCNAPTRSIWTPGPPPPPPKIGSNILWKIYEEMKGLVEDGIIIAKPLMGVCYADVTDLNAVTHILEKLKHLLEIAELDHKKMMMVMCTLYLRNMDNRSRFAWIYMCNQKVPQEFYSNSILNEPSKQLCDQFVQSCAILKSTLVNFLPLVYNWSALYRNGEALRELEMILVLLKNFRTAAFEWAIIAQKIKLQCDYLGARNPYSPEKIKEQQESKMKMAWNIARPAVAPPMMPIRPIREVHEETDEWAQADTDTLVSDNMDLEQDSEEMKRSRAVSITSDYGCSDSGYSSNPGSAVSSPTKPSGSMPPGMASLYDEDILTVFCQLSIK